MPLLMSYYNIFPVILQTIMHKDVHSDDIIKNRASNNMEYYFSPTLNTIDCAMLYTYVNTISMCDSKEQYLYLKFTRIIENMDNNHLNNEIKTSFLNMINKSQRAYYGFMKFANVYKHKSKTPLVTTSLCGDDLDEKKPNVISLLHEGNKYLFSIYELKNMLVKNLSNSSDFFPEPLATKNPYNNIEFLPSNLYNIYFHMIKNQMIIPPLIHGYYKSDLDLIEFEYENELTIREVSITNRLNSSHTSELYPDVIEMLEYHNDTLFKKLNIDGHFPRKKLVTIMKPYLGLFYGWKYSYLRSKRHKANKVLGDKLKAFINFNKDFGKKIDNDNNDIRFNDGHIDFYDDIQTVEYLRSPRTRRREAATFNSMVSRIRTNFEEQGIINNRSRRPTSLEGTSSNQTTNIIDEIENNSDYNADTDSTTSSSLGMPPLIAALDTPRIDTPDINNSLTDDSLDSQEGPSPIIVNNRPTLNVSLDNPFLAMLNNIEPISEEPPTPTYRVGISPDSPIRINNRMDYTTISNTHSNISPTLLNILTGITTSQGICRNCQATYVRGINEEPTDITYHYCINCAEDVIPSLDTHSNIYVRPSLNDANDRYTNSEITPPVLRRSIAAENLLDSYNIVREYSNNTVEDTIVEEELSNSSTLISHTQDEEPHLIVHTPTRLTFDDDDDEDEICTYDNDNVEYRNIDGHFNDLPHLTQRGIDIFLQPLGRNNYHRVPSPMSITTSVSDTEEIYRMGVDDMEDMEDMEDDDIEEDDLFDD